jgi:hypothetical protein
LNVFPANNSTGRKPQTRVNNHKPAAYAKWQMRRRLVGNNLLFKPEAATHHQRCASSQQQA